MILVSYLMNILRYIGVFMLFSLLWMQTAKAEVDAMELALLQVYQQKQPVSWDNTLAVDVDDQGIINLSQWKMRGIRLQPQQQYRFYLPAYESLRLYNPEHPVQASMLRAYLSNGTGLQVETDIQTSTDGHSLIIAPQSAKPIMVMITGSKQQTETMDLAVFISRQQHLSNIAPYRDLHALSGKWAWLSKKPLQIPELYVQMPADHQQLVSVKGPSRIVIKNRLLFEPLETGFIQDYRISYQLDDSSPIWLDFASSAETNRYTFINAIRKTLGREQRAYIDIPKGKHRLQLISDRNLYVQVLKQDQNDYLLPILNEPPLTVRAVRHQGLMAKQLLPEISAAAEKVVRDNSRQLSTLSSQQSLKQAALQRMDYPAGLAAAEKILGQRTFYRNVLPSTKNALSDQFNAYFINQQLRSIGQSKPDIVSLKQQYEVALNSIGNAYFNEVGMTADSYQLPKRYATTQLKIIADKRQCQNGYFNIQLDQQPVQKILINCQPQSNDLFVATPAEYVLSGLQKKTGHSKNQTLSHLFAAYRQPAQIIPVAMHEVMLPQQIKELKVWRDINAIYPLNLAIQIRVAKPYQFSEQSYLTRVHELSQTQLFNLFVDNLKGQPKAGNEIEQQLQNSWIPLKRFLTGLYRQYKSSVADEIPIASLANKEQLQNWKNKAQSAENQEKWIVALEQWSQIVNNSQGLVRDQAQFAQANILSQLSEDYLAQTLWRYLSLYAEPVIAKQAETQLLSKYRQEHDNVAIQRLAAAMFIQRPDQQSLRILITALFDNEQYRFALLLGQTFIEPPVDLMLKAAYQLGWWQSYQQLLMQLPKKQQRFWLGLRAQKQGDFQLALKQWKEAGLESWSEHLQQGLDIKQQLIETEDVGQLYKSWSHWQQVHPGDRHWQDASFLVKDAVGTDQYYALERDLYSKAFRGTKQRPVKLRVMGPVKLNFKVRVLHKQADTNLDGWLNITDNSEVFRSPFSNNRSVQGLILNNEEDYLLGNLMSLDYQVGQGIHEIELSSDIAPVSLNVSKQQPRLMLSVLAPLQIDTFINTSLVSKLLTEAQLKNIVPATASVSMVIRAQNLTLDDLQKRPAVDDVIQAEIRIMQYLALMEQTKENITELLFAAERLQQNFPENKMIQSVWRRMARRSQWQTVNSIVSAAGIRFIDTVGWLPASPVLNIRKALISKSEPDEHVLFSDQGLRLMMTNLNARTLHIDTLLDDLPFLPDSPVQLMYQIDEQTPKYLTLSVSDGWKKFTLPVSAGQHQLRFYLGKGVSNQFVKLRFRDYLTDLNVAQERMFFVSSKTEPLQLHVHGPVMMRIDEWSKGKMISRYQQVAEGWQSVTIPVTDGQEESLLQIKQRVVIDEKKPGIKRVIQRKIRPVALPLVQTPALEKPALVEVNDVYKLAGQSDGTWSFGTDLIRKNNTQEDRGQSSPEQYQQARVNHRYFDEFREIYWDTEGFVRTREKGKPSFGLKESVTIKADDYPFTLKLDGKVISQVVEDDPEWLGEFKVALSQSAHLTPKTMITPKLSWFGRYLSLRDQDERVRSLKGQVDQDLYTNYKAQHTTGFSSSLSVIHNPWLDTRWTAKFNAVSNENMNLFNPDSISSEAHWKQLLGDVSLDGSYRISFYQNNTVRNSNSVRHFTKLKFNWQSWTQNFNRFEVSGQYNYDIDNKEHLGMLSFTYHFEAGRGYRDFSSSEIDFQGIRERRSLDAY